MSDLTRIRICPYCKKRFKSPIWADRHVCTSKYDRAWRSRIEGLVQSYLDSQSMLARIVSECDRCGRQFKGKGWMQRHQSRCKGRNNVSQIETRADAAPRQN